jgi:hypothetical protein
VAQAKFSIGQVNFTEHLLVIAYEASNPTAEVARQSFAPAHPTTRNIVFEDLNATPHIFEFRQSDDGVDLGLLYNSFSIDVGLIQDSVVEIFDLVVDGGDTYDPVDGDDSVTHPSFENLLVISKPGFGLLSNEVDYEKTTATTIHLLNDVKFSNGERYTFVIFKKQTVAQNTSGRPLFQDIVSIAADTVISAAHYGKLLEANGAAAILTITFPDFTTIPDNTVFGFNTESGAQRYLKIVFTGADGAKLKGGVKSTFCLGKNEDAAFIKKGTRLYKMFWDGDYYRVGEVVISEIQPANSVAELGGWLLIADYPRLYNEFVNLLDPSLLGDISTLTGGEPVAAERTKWCIDLANSRFWVPDSGGYFDRSNDPNGDVDVVNANRKAGVQQADGMKSISVTMNFGRTKRGSGSDPDHAAAAPDGNTFGAAFTKTATYSGQAEVTVKNISRYKWRMI